jgi:hypothetical protein
MRRPGIEETRIGFSFRHSLIDNRINQIWCFSIVINSVLPGKNPVSEIRKQILQERDFQGVFIYFNQLLEDIQ